MSMTFCCMKCGVLFEGAGTYGGLCDDCSTPTPQQVTTVSVETHIEGEPPPLTDSELIEGLRRDVDEIKSLITFALKLAIALLVFVSIVKIVAMMIGIDSILMK